MTVRPHNFVKDEFYHIYAHGIGNLQIFQEKRDYERFLTLMFAANSEKPIPRLDRAIDLNLVWDIRDHETDIREPLVDIVCFCLMPTHFHLLLGERGEANISKYLHRILVSHSKYFNLKYDRRGHLFENKFNSKHIGDNEYLSALSCYIHKNSKDIPSWKDKEEKYPWSSYQDFVSENRWQHLLNREIVAGQFDNMEKYKNFVNEHYNDEILLL